VKGIAHITGGGIAGNLERVLPDGVRAELDLSDWTAPPNLALIRERGEVSTAEMHRAFILGGGMAFAVSEPVADAVLASVEGAMKIGQICAQGSSESGRVAIICSDGLGRVEV